MIGASAPTLQDVHSTPTASDQLMSGPEIQANAISTALRGLPLRDAPGWTGVLALLLLGALPALAHLRTRGMRAAVVTPVAALAFAGGRAGRLRRAAGSSTATYPLLALALGTRRHDDRGVRRPSAASAAASWPRQRRARAARARAHRASCARRQLEIVQRLSQAAESRDGDTGEHIQRISRMTERARASRSGCPRPRPS